MGEQHSHHYSSESKTNEKYRRHGRTSDDHQRHCEKYHRHGGTSVDHQRRCEKYHRHPGTSDDHQVHCMTNDYYGYNNRTKSKSPKVRIDERHHKYKHKWSSTGRRRHEEECHGSYSRSQSVSADNSGEIVTKLDTDKNTVRWCFEEDEFDSRLEMSSTSQKHRNFVSEPMGDKEVRELAGIGEVLGGRLQDEGFDKAYVVLGQFLLLKKNKDLFVEWVKDICGANSKQSADCYGCLNEWCDAFL